MASIFERRPIEFKGIKFTREEAAEVVRLFKVWRFAQYIIDLAGADDDIALRIAEDAEANDCGYSSDGEAIIDSMDYLIDDGLDIRELRKKFARAAWEEERKWRNR